MHYDFDRKASLLDWPAILALVFIVAIAYLAVTEPPDDVRRIPIRNEVVAAQHARR